MCQSFGTPSSAEYWHMGDTTMRFLSVMSFRRNSENSADMGIIQWCCPYIVMEIVREENMKIEGQCLCGKIAYEAHVDPAKASICNCTDCQTLSGSPYGVSV